LDRGLRQFGLSPRERRPFTRQTHGGPCQYSSALVSKSQLRGVCIRLEPDAEPVYAWIPEDDFLESAYEARTDIGDDAPVVIVQGVNIR